MDDEDQGYCANCANWEQEVFDGDPYCNFCQEEIDEEMWRNGD